MANIDLDNDLVAFLRENERLTGITASNYLRAALRGQRISDSISNSEDATPVFGHPARATTALYVFLQVLSSAAEKYPETFNRISEVSGRTRIYFSTRSEDIENSGHSTFPVRIPGSEWFVISNTSTRDKRKILQRAFREIGCSREDAKSWFAKFDRAVAEETASDDKSSQSHLEDSEIKI